MRSRQCKVVFVLMAILLETRVTMSEKCEIKHITHGTSCPPDGNLEPGESVAYACENDLLPNRPQKDPLDNDTFAEGPKYNYYLEGEAVLTCQENGKWSDALPSCEPLECLVPGWANYYMGEEFSGRNRDNRLKNCRPWVDAVEAFKAKCPVEAEETVRDCLLQDVADSLSDANNYPEGNVEKVTNRCRSPSDEIRGFLSYIKYPSDIVWCWDSSNGFAVCDVPICPGAAKCKFPNIPATTKKTL